MLHVYTGSVLENARAISWKANSVQILKYLATLRSTWNQGLYKLQMNMFDQSKKWCFSSPQNRLWCLPLVTVQRLLLSQYDILSSFVNKWCHMSHIDAAIQCYLLHVEWFWGFLNHIRTWTSLYIECPLLRNPACCNKPSRDKRHSMTFWALLLTSDVTCHILMPPFNAICFT